MKKILPIFIAITLLFVMAIPTFAQDYVYGEVQLSDINEVWTDQTNYPYATILSVKSTGNIELYLSPSKPTLDNYYMHISDAIHYNYTNNAWTDRTVISNSVIMNDKVSIVWCSHDLYLNGKLHFSATEPLLPPSCDGTSCPANDANLDGICDDCGAPMTMSLRSPTLESLKASASYYHYFIYKTVDSVSGEYIDTRLSFVSSNSPMTLTKAEWDRLNDSAWGNITYRFTSETDIDGVNYVSHDGGTTWQRETTFSNGTTLFNIDENIITSTFDITDVDTGKVFFPLPLWEVTQGITTETLTEETLPAVSGTMSTLILCGVGLMACLMVFVLFGKRSQIFHL